MEERIERLERENRRLRRAGLVALAVITAVMVMGQATSGTKARVVEAEHFFVRDADGKIRGTLGTHSDGTVELGLYRDGLTSAKSLGIWPPVGTGGGIKLSISPTGDAELAIYTDKDILPRIQQRVNADGTTDLTLASRLHEASIYLAIGSGGRSTIRLVDKAGMTRFGPGARLALQDEAGHAAVLGYTELKTPATGVIALRPASSLVLFDKEGKVIWSAP